MNTHPIKTSYTDGYMIKIVHRQVQCIFQPHVFNNCDILMEIMCTLQYEHKRE